MYEHLRFRRQFLLARAPIAALHDWQCVQIGSLRLYAHPDLALHVASVGARTVALLGSIFDPRRPELGNADLLDDIVSSATDIDTCSARFKPLCGIYAFLYIDPRGAVVQQDALALREVYYCDHDNLVVCASQPNLAAKYANPVIALNRDPKLIDFRSRHFKDGKWIGEETCFQGIRHLLPNHRLDIPRRTAMRYWPDRALVRLPLDEAVRTGSEFLKGAMRAITHRHSVMMAVTAGADSRTLLAASRDVSDRIHYFVNDQGLGDEHPDIAVPKQMFEGIGKPFHVHRVASDIDEDFRRVFLDNVFHASDRVLPTIQNVYFKQLGDKVNILGCGEIARTRYGAQPSRLDAFRVAYKLGYQRSDYVLDKSQAICSELAQVGQRFAINPLTLLYWEQTRGNWGSVGNSESDIAIEEIDPYDSHFLYETFLSVDPKYCRYRDSPCVLFRELIECMWPQLLNWPVNPAFTTKSRIDQLLGRMRLFSPLKELKYRLTHLALGSRTR
jgi:hypothetical protein